MSGADRIRVLTYNLRDLKDDVPSIVRVIRAVEPDVVCLQEVPRRPFSGHRVGRLADECGLLWAGGGAGSGGTAILTSVRMDVLETSAERLPVHGMLTRSRGFARALVRVPGGPTITVVSVHLSLDERERVVHAQRLLDPASGAGSQAEPCVVAGDLNETEGGAAWTMLHDRLGDAAGRAESGGPEPTFRSRRIDAVFVSPAITVSSLRIPGPADGVDAADVARASDHRPVLADLVVPQRSAS